MKWNSYRIYGSSSRTAVNELDRGQKQPDRVGIHDTMLPTGHHDKLNSNNDNNEVD